MPNREASGVPTLLVMKRESRLGRALWLVLLVLLGGYVVADFVRSPFSAPRGSAAVRPAAVTIWVPAGGGGDESGPVLAQAAAGLEVGGHRAVVRSIPGGSAGALISFLSRHRPGRGQLLAISSTTLADLAHDRRETLVPGAAEEAALARALLRRSKPIGMLADEPLELAVERGSPIHNGSELVATIAAAPEELLFGIDDDTFSRDQLAAFVERAGVDGEVHFSVFQTADEADRAIATGAAETVLVGRPALRDGRLRTLGWPLPTPQPRAWVGLVARPSVGAAELADMRVWVTKLQTDRHWRTHLRAEGRRPADPGTHALARLVRHSAPADRLEQVAERVERN
jgi:tripartite-type tricarboxylate transporter receptor subunit TctC